LLVTNTGIRPAAMVPTVIATEKLAVLAIVGIAAIHQVLARYGRRDKCKNKILPVNIPGTSISNQSIPVAGKSDEKIVATVTQAVTTAIGIKHNLSTVDQSKLDSQLCSQKLTFINTIADNRGWEQTQHRFNRYHATMDQIKNSARISRDQEIRLFRMKNIIARLPKNLPGFQKDIQAIKSTFVDCNSPNLVRRIEARTHLSHLVECDPDLFGNIKEVACNLQAHYFDKDKLVDISYDKRLAETTWVLFRKRPFHWGEKELKKFVGIAKRDNLDLEDGFERLYRRINFQLSAKEKQQNKEYEPKAKWGKGKIFTHDRHKQILNESYNGKLFEVAALCEEGQFEKALFIANKFRSTIKNPMMNVIDHYRQNSISLAPHSNSPGIEQPISDIAPSPLPPNQDPDRDKEQEQNVPPEERRRIKQSQEKHTWGNRPGHLVKTPKNIKLIEDVANDPECHIGPPDDRGHYWHGKILEDGRQVWAKVRNNEIIGWGVNKPGNIRTYNPRTGLDAPKAPKTPKALKVKKKFKTLSKI